MTTPALQEDRRPFYVKLFDAVERIIVTFANAVAAAKADVNLSASGYTNQVAAPQQAASDAMTRQLATISDAITADMAAVDAVLAQPQPLLTQDEAVNIGLRRDRFLSQFADNMEPDKVLRRLSQAVEDGDAIAARALIYIIEDNVMPNIATGDHLLNLDTRRRFTDLQQLAEVMWASGERQLALSNRHDVLVPADNKRNFADYNYGSLIARIIQDAGQHPLPGVFTFDFPMPFSWYHGASYPASAWGTALLTGEVSVPTSVVSAPPVVRGNAT